MILKMMAKALETTWEALPKFMFELLCLAKSPQDMDTLCLREISDEYEIAFLYKTIGPGIRSNNQ